MVSTQYTTAAMSRAWSTHSVALNGRLPGGAARSGVNRVTDAVPCRRCAGGRAARPPRGEALKDARGARIRRVSHDLCQVPRVAQAEVEQRARATDLERSFDYRGEAILRLIESGAGREPAGRDGA